MDGRTEPIVVEEAADNGRCSIEPCGEFVAAELNTGLYCLHHFLSISFQDIRSRHEHLRAKECNPATTGAFKEFLTAWARQAVSLVEDERLEDQATKARLSEALVWVSQATESLRRSPRSKTTVPVWLRREDPRHTWEEDTWTSTLSRHGAGFICRHPVETGGTVFLTRKDKGGRAAARVVYSRMDSEGRRQVGVELIDRDDFWD